MQTKYRERIRGLKQRFLKNARNTPPLVALRIVAAFIIFSPWFLYALFASWLKINRWKKIEVCRHFMHHHKLAFEDMDISTLTVRLMPGGVSNANQLWICKKKTGEEQQYYVKIFVPVGTFWAKHMSRVSPFPRIYGGETHERFTVDMISRVQLAEKGIDVPRLIAYDTVEKVMVTEYLQGESVDEVLKRIGERNQVQGDDWEIVRQCGVGLAKVHRSGFSLIDTQPVNCIWETRQRKVYFTDLEFCTRQDKRIWDVGFFLCFLAIRLAGPLKGEVRKIFLESYQNERQLNLVGVSETNRELREYLPVFQTILDLRQYTPEQLLEEILSIA